MDNPQIELARKIIETTDTSLFLTGKAGTGKTTFLRRLRSESPKRMVVLAEVAELQKKSLRIEQQYCTRLRKIVGACKLVKAINAERAFGRKAFKKMTK